MTIKNPATKLVTLMLPQGTWNLLVHRLGIPQRVLDHENDNILPIILNSEAYARDCADMVAAIVAAPKSIKNARG